jgi:sphingosine kinase
MLSSCTLSSCSFYSIDSKHRGHAVKIASEIQLDNYDAVVAVSGDGTLHELVNGFAQHEEPIRAFRMPLAVIPAGSGNAMSLNIMGANVRVLSSSSPRVTHLFFRTA